MLNIARGNEIASSVSGIALVGEMLRSCPSFSGIDRLRLPKTSRGHVSHGAAVACAVCLAALGLLGLPEERFSRQIYAMPPLPP